MRGRKRALKITWREAWPIWLTFGILTGLGTLGIRAVIPATPVPARTLLPDEDAVVPELCTQRAIRTPLALG